MTGLTLAMPPVGRHAGGVVAPAKQLPNGELEIYSILIVGVPLDKLGDSTGRLPMNPLSV